VLRRFGFLFIVIFTVASPLAAQSQPSTKIWGADFTPYVGYRTSMSFDTVSEVQGVTPRIVLDSNPSYGLAAGVRFLDENVVEFRWARQDTHMDVTGTPPVFPQQRVLLDQFHFDFTREYVLRYWPVWARPFVTGGVGWTRISSTNVTNTFTRFSFGIGGGIKAFPSPHFGVKVQAQWLPIWVDPEVRTLCNVVCVLHLTGQLASQGEFSIGPVIRF
jgi:hypothetical protein